MSATYSPAARRGRSAAPAASRDGVDPYLRSRVMTAPPEQLQLMLFDGAIRFAERGRAALEAREYEASYEAIRRARRIVEELALGLRPDADPDLAGRLAQLYDFTFRRLVTANLERDVEALDDALLILRHQRETWTLFLKQMTRPGTAGTTPAADATERLSLSA